MILRGMQVLGTLAVLAVGAVHLQQYIAGYSAVPTVGTLFLFNAIAAAIVGLGLLASSARGWRARPADAATGLLALSAVGIAAGSLTALFISESSSLFGFSESGYSTPIVLAIVSEAATVALLGPVAVACLGHPRRQPPAMRHQEGGRGPHLEYRAAKPR